MTPRIASRSVFRTVFCTTGLAACLMAGGVALAQVPPPPPGPLSPPSVQPSPPGGPVAPGAGTAVTGRVQQWLLNPNGEADGLLLADGTQVVFPPHLSAAAMAMLKPGDTVRVGGWRAPAVPTVADARSVQLVRMQSLDANGRSLADPPPAPGMAPPPPRDVGALAALSASGRIERLLYTDRGDVRGVVLADRTIVRFPPHIGATYAGQLQPGAQLHARGWGVRGAQGTALEATGLGPSADAVREVFGGPGLAPARPGRGGPPGPLGARGPGNEGLPPPPVPAS